MLLFVVFVVEDDHEKFAMSPCQLQVAYFAVVADL